MRFHKVLCAVDYSSGSREALRYAVELVRGTDAELVLVHVWQVPYLADVGPGMTVELFTESRTRAEHDLAAWRAEAVGLGAGRVTSVLLTGAPWHELVELARRDPAIDLIVVGTHGRTGIKHVLLGSVAEKVVRHASCPVVVARARD